MPGNGLHRGGFHRGIHGGGGLHGSRAALVLLGACLVLGADPAEELPPEPASTTTASTAAASTAAIPGDASTTTASTAAPGDALTTAEPARPLRQSWGAGGTPLTGGYAHSPLHELIIPGLDQALTRQYIRQYSSPGGLAWLQQIMERGGPYLGFIRGEIERRGLPPELLYLPVIESGYLSTARSRSGAVGLWQFMSNSIAPFNIRVTEWVDERMDFWKSTDGALRKLEENYRFFEDWPLALAAYNAGLGGIRQIVQRTGIRDYWTLADRGQLKTETAHYVPKLLAVAYIVSNPRYFGLDLTWGEDPRWTRLPVDKSIDLEILAEAAEIDAALLKNANRELLYGITPPEAGYALKVRTVDVPAVERTLARTDLPLIRYYQHTIRYGDTLSALALHYGVSVEQILSANPGTEARFLRIGGRLRVPALIEAGPYVRSRAAGTALSFEGNHLVKQGETLWSIALAYGVDPELLAEVNNMGLNDTLRVGRSLKTPIIE